MTDQVRIQGNLYSRASCKLKADGEPFAGFDTVEWGQSRERGLAYGSGKSQGPRGRTAGRYKSKELVIGFQSDTALAVKQTLAKKVADAKSYGNAVVLWTLTIDEPGLETQLYEFLSCTLDDEAVSVEDSIEHSVEKLTFNPLRMKHNGLSLYDQSEEG